GGPQFLELCTYRFRAHSMFDPELYRDKAEVDTWKQRDPITLFAALMQRHGLLSDDERTAMEDDIASRVESAAAFAEAGHWEPVETLLNNVHGEQAGAL
ncbi:MAG TPA: thiamine pyrophosphate-dependent enzyme, partial [Gammaproteobacteria bacterium]